MKALQSHVRTLKHLKIDQGYPHNLPESRVVEILDFAYACSIPDVSLDFIFPPQLKTIAAKHFILQKITEILMFLHTRIQVKVREYVWRSKLEKTSQVPWRWRQGNLRLLRALARRFCISQYFSTGATSREPCWVDERIGGHCRSQCPRPKSWHEGHLWLWADQTISVIYRGGIHDAEVEHVALEVRQVRQSSCTHYEKALYLELTLQ